MENRRHKSEFYNRIKIVTTIIVVLGHVTTMYSVNGAIDIKGESAFLEKMTAFIYTFHMPLFYLVTGAVFGYCIEAGKYKDSIAFIKNKWTKLMIPYLVFGIFYVTPIMKYVNLLSVSIPKYIVEGILLSRNPRHLWFLLSLFCIFLFYLPMKEWIRKGNWRYFLLVGIISFIFYKAAYKMPQDFQIRRACLDVLWFYGGIVFNHYYDKLFPIKERNETNMENRETKLGTKARSRKEFDIWNIGITRLIERNSFGIYLIHPMVIYILFYWFRESSIHPLLLSCLIFIMSMGVSILGTEMIRKSGFKIIIGE